MNSISIRSPGRINFIGEHVDYIETYSCPATINLHNDITLLKTSGKAIRIYSDRFGDSKEISYDSIYNNQTDFSKIWYGYFIGILKSLNDKGIKINEGFEVKVVSNLLDGAGLSSSASIETGFLFGLNEIFNLCFNKTDLAKIAKYSENTYMKAPCGIMDQYTVINGKKNSFLFLNYFDLTHKECNLPQDIKYFIIDTKIKHSIAADGYKSRINEKEQITRIISEKFNLSIREAVLKSIDDYELYSKIILELGDSILNKRFNHFVSETDRTIKFYTQLKQGDFNSAFALLNQSHISLSNLYEVSLPLIDDLVLNIQKLPQVIGCRMIGGGFGGSCLAVTEKDFDEEKLRYIVDSINKNYSSNINFFEIKIEDGIYIL